MTESNATLSARSASEPKAGHKVVRVGADGTAWIEAIRCADCGAVMVEQPRACRGCGRRDRLEAFRPGKCGSLYSWAVVHRSYPGIKVPFVSAVVDLDGGLTLKGTLRLDDMGSLHEGMAVTLVMDDAGGATDKEGRPYVGFHFIAGRQAA